MAQFTASLTDPDTRAFDSGVSPSRQGGGGELASLISGGMQVLDTHLRRKEYDTRVAKEEAKEAAKVAAEKASESGKASITKEIINRNLEIIQQQEEAGEIQQEMYALTKDGIPKGKREFERLEELKEKARRLDLLPKGRGRTYMLAAYRQAVDEFAGVVPMDDLRSIFGVAMSDLDKVYEAPEYPPEVTENLQKFFGLSPTGEYTPEQVATAHVNYQAKKRMREDATLSMGNIVASSRAYAITDGQPIVADAALTAAKQGGVLNDQQISDFLKQIEDKRMQTIVELENQGKNFTNARIDVSKERVEALKELNAGYDYMASLFSGPGAFADPVRALKKIQATNETITALNEHGMLKYGPFMKVMKELGGPESLKTILTATPEQLKLVFGPDADPNELKMMGGKVLQASMEVDGLREAVRTGAVSLGDATFWAANAGAPNAKTPVQVVNSFQAMVDGVSRDTFNGVVEAMVTPKTVAATKEQAKGSADVKDQLATTAIVLLDRIGADLPPIYHKYISIDRVGNITLQNVSDPAARSVINEFQRKFNNYNKFASVYSTEIGGQLKQAQDFYKSLNVEEDQQTQQQE